MTNMLTVPLEGCVPGGANIEILRAEMRTDVASFLVLVRYSEHGREPQYGLRLDLDKKVFIDHLEDVEQESFMQRIAPELADILNPVRQEVRFRQLGYIKEDTASKAVSEGIEAAHDATRGIDVEAGQRVGRTVTATATTTATNIEEYTTGQTARHIAASARGAIVRSESMPPGVQTGSHAIDGSGAPDTRSIEDLINEATSTSRRK